VIPTKVGIQNVKSKETVFPDKFLHRQLWIPACAGMTGCGFSCGVFRALLFCYNLPFLRMGAV
ncbi:TPA: hypothetical protein ACLBHU_002119, partial [Neisseria meningitidis]